MRLLTIKQVASRLAVSAKTIRRWVEQKKFPTPLVLPGDLHRWHYGEVESWLMRVQTEVKTK